MKEVFFTKADAIKVMAEIASYIDSLDDKKTYRLSVVELKERRSLNANAYAWVLIDKLAAKLNIGKTDIYRSYIKEIGGNSDIVCVQNKALNDLRKAWETRGIGWLTDTLPSKIEGCTNVVLYYGSSTYDTAQMSRLINLIIQDCKENDIEYLTPSELAKMLKEWGEDV